MIKYYIFIEKFQKIQKYEIKEINLQTCPEEYKVSQGAVPCPVIIIANVLLYVLKYLISYSLETFLCVYIYFLMKFYYACYSLSA